MFGLKNLKYKDKIFNNVKKIYRKYQKELNNSKLELVKIDLKKYSYLCSGFSRK